MMVNPPVPPEHPLQPWEIHLLRLEIAPNEPSVELWEKLCAYQPEEKMAQVLIEEEYDFLLTGTD